MREVDDGPDILSADYKQFVEESKTLDGNLTSFDAYDQIYKAYKQL